MRKPPIQKISQKANEAGIPFLIIGGHAVYAHGYVRTTDDLDLIVPRGQRERWSKLLGDFGMVLKNDAATFLQFDPKNETDTEIDLMFVSEQVFEQLNQSAIDAKIDSVAVRVVSLLHLIALKCHSLQNSKTLRRLKDMDDLIQLILVNHLDLNESELRTTILSTEIRNFMKNYDKPVPMNDNILRDAPGLEFPDWSGLQPHRSRMTFEEAVRWNEEMLSLFPPKKLSRKLEAERRCNVEFIL